MKTTIILALYLFCSVGFFGCAQTIVKENGKTVLVTQANAKRVVYRSAAGSYLEVDGLNHSTPTRAGGSVVGTATAGALPIVTALATKGAL